MIRRFMLIAGLILLVFALAGIGLLPQSGLQSANQTRVIHLPDSLGSPAEPGPVVFGSASNPVANFAAAPPWLTAALLFFMVAAAVGGSLLAARFATRVNDPPEPPASGGRAALAGGALIMGWGVLAIAICLLGLCGVIGYLVFGQRLVSDPPQPGVSVMELTNQFMQTQVANTQASTGPLGTLSPGEMTSDFMQTQIAATATAYPTAAPPTPIFKATTTGQPEPVNLTIDWPQQMDVTDTSTVVIRWSPQFYASGTEPAPFADPFGSDYQGVVTVTLSGDGYEITPSVSYSGAQSLDDAFMVWYWDIRPVGGPGPRRLDVLVEGTWTPANGQRETIRRTLGRFVLVADVTQPIIPPYRTRQLTLAAGLLGALLCIPWLYASFRHGRPA